MFHLRFLSLCVCESARQRVLEITCMEVRLREEFARLVRSQAAKNFCCEDSCKPMCCVRCACMDFLSLLTIYTETSGNGDGKPLWCLVLVFVRRRALSHIGRSDGQSK